MELPEIGSLVADGTTRPAEWVVKSGRPQKKRIRSIGEQGGTAVKLRRCGRCGQLGRHHHQTCARAPEEV